MECVLYLPILTNLTHLKRRCHSEEPLSCIRQASQDGNITANSTFVIHLSGPTYSLKFPLQSARFSGRCCVMCEDVAVKAGERWQLAALAGVDKRVR